MEEMASRLELLVGYFIWVVIFYFIIRAIQKYLLKNNSSKKTAWMISVGIILGLIFVFT